MLIRKLSHYEIRGIANDWFTSYLHNRRQHVSIGSTKSDDIVITHIWSSAGIGARSPSISRVY